MAAFDCDANGPWFNAGRPVELESLDGSKSVGLIDLPENPDQPLTPLLLAPAFGRPKEGVSAFAEVLVGTGQFAVFRPSLLHWGDEARSNFADFILWPDEIIHWGKFLRTEAFRERCRQINPEVAFTDQVAGVAVSASCLNVLHAQEQGEVFDALALVSFSSDAREFLSRKAAGDYDEMIATDWALRLKNFPRLAACFAAIARRRSGSSSGRDARRYELLAKYLEDPGLTRMSVFNVVIEDVPIPGRKAIAESKRGMWGNIYDLNHQAGRASRIKIPLTFVLGGQDDFNAQSTFDEFIVGARESGRLRRAIRLEAANHYLQPFECFESAAMQVIDALQEDLGLEKQPAEISPAKIALRRLHETRGGALRNASRLGITTELYQRLLLPKKGLVQQLRLLFERPDELATYARLLARSARERGDGTTILADLEPARFGRILNGAIRAEDRPRIARGLAQAADCLSALFSLEVVEQIDVDHLQGIFGALSEIPEAANALLETVNPRLLDHLGKRFALAQARRAARGVPAYADLLSERGQNFEELRFEQLPYLSKENYVMAYPLAERCVGGSLPQDGGIDESSGSTGTPIDWVHSRAEEDRRIGTAVYTLKYLFGADSKNAPMVVINTFSQGAWSSANKLSTLARWGALVKNIGTDIPKILDSIRALGPDYHYVVSGYPPFLRELLYVGETRGLDWHKYRVDLLHGGEGYTTGWLNAVRARLGEDSIILSSYGSSDLDVGVGIETPLVLELRKFLENSPPARMELLGTDQMPCFLGQYNPTDFYLEERINPGGQPTLVATVGNPLCCSPKVRYDTGDLGRLLPFETVRTYLEHRMEGPLPRPLQRLPFLFLWGRRDGTISLDGANIYPAQVEEALLQHEALAPLVRSFRLRRAEREDGTTSFEVDIETFEQGRSNTEQLRRLAADAVRAHLRQVNADYRESYENNPAALEPRVRLVAPGALENERRIKHRYIEIAKAAGGSDGRVRSNRTRNLGG